MKFTELDPHFLKIIDDRTHLWQGVSLAEADGVQFECPLEHCHHQVICWQPHVPKDVMPGPGRWKLVGTGLDDLSLVAGSSSVEIKTCRAHFYIRNGQVEMVK